MSAKLSRRSFVLSAAALPLLAACGGTASPAAPAQPTTASAAAPAQPTAASPAAPAQPTAAPTTAPTPAPAVATPTAAPKPSLVWWHHWASEPAKQKTLQTFFDDYAKEQGVKINIRWWEKADMYPVAKNAFIAGKDFPDVMYGPPDEFITAGWFAELIDAIDWSQFQDGAKERTIRKIGDKTSIWDPPLEGSSEEIYYNPKIFEKVGITVPDSRQFTVDEFFDVCTKLRQAGFDPLAQGVGDRNYPGRGLFNDGFLTKLGGDDAKKLMTGQLPWTTPAVREVLEWGAKLAKIPVMPPNFATMKLAESHTYFHTPPPGKDLPRAAMFFVGAWYTGRAFQPPEKGGEPKDFRVSFLKYPSFGDGKGTGLQWGGGGGGGGSVAAQSKVKDAAIAAVRGLLTIKYGSIWFGLSYVPTELKIDAKLAPDGGYPWYSDVWAKTHQDAKYVATNYTVPPALDQAITAAYNEGIPENQITVDQAIEILEKGRASH